MFDGIKILCMGSNKKHSYEKCLNPMIVPEKMFLKIANLKFSCPSCALKNNKIQSYFQSAIQLRKIFINLKKTGVYIESYNLAFESCHDQGFYDLPPYLLENKDWTTWNMQLASITIANLEMTSMKMKIWEDHNFKAMPFYYSQFPPETFESILSKNSISLGDKSIEISLLKTLVKEIRSYNSAWRDMVDAGLSAVPVDLNHELYTHFAGVDSLDELFPENERYD